MGKIQALESGNFFINFGDHKNNMAIILFRLKTHAVLYRILRMATHAKILNRSGYKGIRRG